MTQRYTSRWASAECRRLPEAPTRLAHGAVADFVLFRITTTSFNFRWYVFNLADAAIVIGVAALIYEMLLGGEAAKK